MRHIKVGGAQIRAYFDVRLLDGTSPALSETGGQPEYSINGGAFNPSGIGVLAAVSYGRYYAELSTAVATTPGDVILTRYKSGLTTESRGDTFLVVEADGTLPDDAISIAHYGDVASGDAYFASSLSGRKWKRSSVESKRLGLIDATKLIDKLNFAGSKASALQVLQFPRANSYVDPLTATATSTSDVNVPDDIKSAAYIIADRLLDGWDPDIEADNLATSVSKFQGASTMYNREYMPEHMRAGIPSARAWSLLRPFVRDPHEVTLLRV